MCLVDIPSTVYISTTYWSIFFRPCVKKSTIYGNYIPAAADVRTVWPILTTVHKLDRPLQIKQNQIMTYQRQSPFYKVLIGQIRVHEFIVSTFYNCTLVYRIDVQDEINVQVGNFLENQ